MKTVYYEDLELNKKELLGECVADKREMIEFARKWDPQPFHMDDELAKSTPYGGIIAPVGYTMALINRMAAQNETRVASMGGLGKDKMRYPNAVRPGDRISVTVEHLQKRESTSMPGVGIVLSQIEVLNQKGELVLTYEATFMVAKQLSA